MGAVYKKYIKIGIVIALVTVTAVCVMIYTKTLKNEESVKLREGMYSLNSYGSLFFEKNEKVSLKLLMYYYSEDMDNTKLMRYKDFSLLTKDGGEIKTDVTDEMKNNFKRLEEHKMLQGEIDITLSDDLVSGEPLVITGIKYKDENNKEKVVNIGEISVKKTQFENKFLNATATKAVWTAFMLPFMKTYDLYIEKKEEAVIKDLAVEFGMDKIKSRKPDKEIEDEEEIEIDVHVADDIEGNFIFYMKPLINFESDGDLYTEVQTNICRRNYINGEKPLYDYFLQIQKDAD